jgi:hypothetical protein
MDINIYKRLAHALDLLPSGFPQTKSGVKLQILQKIFSPEDTQIASNMTGMMEEVGVIATRANLSKDESEKNT